MITLGIDLAAGERSTAACLMEWSGSSGTTSHVETGLSDQRLVELADSTDKVGIDVPLGWPQAFVRALAAHHAGEPWPDVSRARLRYRETDRYIRETVGVVPLSVSTDRIGVTAMRAAELLRALTMQDRVDRSGGGRVVEVYPAAALARWDLPHSRYKRAKNAERRAELLERMTKCCEGWLNMPDEIRSACEAGDHVLDAFICALIARASAVGLVEPIPHQWAKGARVEGWIALPVPGSLEQLGGVRKDA